MGNITFILIILLEIIVYIIERSVFLKLLKNIKKEDIINE